MNAFDPTPVDDSVTGLRDNFAHTQTQLDADHHPRTAPFEQLADNQTLGRYVVLDTLGSGGMGTVLRAYDRELDRPVAIKVLHDRLGVHHTTRLIREAQALAKLSHPNVVQVYEVGQLKGQTFVAMELVKGQTPIQWMQKTPRPGWRECVQMFIQLGEGLAAAHERGLVHRDFKPGNAIIDEKGRARVLDFGLARRTNERDGPRKHANEFVANTQLLDAELTKTGSVLGTPAYMPIEQMLGRGADARSDQFSFCVSLYEALYGCRPFRGQTIGALMAAMTQEQVEVAPRDNHVPSSLRAVIIRGLAHNPDARWPSMESLLRELRRIVAPPRVWRGVAGAGLGLTAIVGVVALWQSDIISQKDRQLVAQNTELARQVVELEQQKRRAEDFAQQLKAELAAQRGLRAKDTSKRDGHGLAAVRLAVQAHEGLAAKSPEVRAAVFAGLTHALANIGRVEFRGHKQRVYAVAVSPNDRLAATASQDKTIRLWNLRTGEHTGTLEGHNHWVRRVAFSPDGTLLASASVDKTVKLWTLASGKAQTFNHPDYVHAVAFSPDGTQLGTTSGNDAWLWHIGSDAPKRFAGHTDQVRTIAFTPDAQHLVTGGEDQTARVWDPQTGAAVLTLEGHTDTVYDVVVSRDGTQIVTGSRDQTARIWDRHTGRQQVVFDQGDAVFGVDISADGSSLAAATFAGHARVWDIETGSLRTMVHHADAVADIAFTHTGEQLLTGSWDGTAHLWDLDLGHSDGALLRLPLPRRADAVAFSPNGTQLAVGTGDGTIQLWDPATGMHRATLTGHRIDVLAVAYSPKGRLLATASWDGSVRVWDARSREHQLTLSGHTGPVVALAWSTDGKRLVTASRDGTAAVWDAGGARIQSVSHGAPVVDAALAADGEQLITVGADNHAQQWMVKTGDPVKSATDEPASAVTVSPNGRHLALAGKDAIRVLDFATGETQATCGGYADTVTNLAFSRDGKLLAAASRDQTARVWEISTGETIAVFPHRAPVTNVAFRPGGRHLATASGEHVARIWTLDPQPWLTWGCAKLDDVPVGACTQKRTSARRTTQPHDEPIRSRANDLSRLETITVHGVELVRLPAGRFTMGSPPGERGRDPSEGPQHEVTLDSFYIARTELTNAQYAEYLAANPDVLPPASWGNEHFDQPNQPVVALNWFEAKAYCDWAGFELPTEAQWEYAARAGQTTAYWFGDEAEDLRRFGWTVENAGGKERGDDQAHPRSVASLGANPWGLFDVHGNVREWTKDGATFSYASPVRPGDGLRKSPRNQPNRIVRDGAWDYAAAHTRAAQRFPYAASSRNLSLSFRPVRNIAPNR